MKQKGHIGGTINLAPTNSASINAPKKTLVVNFYDVSENWDNSRFSVEITPQK